MSFQRIPISKGLRFNIFTRDGYCCRYCGRQSDVVALAVDHVIPVCKGGTNDEENLVTSCVDCNAGKAGKLITQTTMTETDRLRIAQEMQEQAQSANRAIEASNARLDRQIQFMKFWVMRSGRKDYHKPTLRVIFAYVLEYGEEVVCEWVDIASGKCDSDIQMGKYISGCRRKIKAQECSE